MNKIFIKRKLKMIFINIAKIEFDIPTFRVTIHKYFMNPRTNFSIYFRRKKMEVEILLENKN